MNAPTGDPLYFASPTYSAKPVKSKVPSRCSALAPRERQSRGVCHERWHRDGGRELRVDVGHAQVQAGVTKQTFYVQILQRTITTPKTVSNPSSGAMLGVPNTAVPTIASATSAGIGLAPSYNFIAGHQHAL